MQPRKGDGICFTPFFFFTRTCTSVTDASGCQNRYALAQYWFDGPQIALKLKPHGNSKSGQPYFRTAASAQVQHKIIASKSTPKPSVEAAVKQQGGEMHARGLNKLPRNVQQMKNYRRSEVKKDGDVLYSVMLQCKMSEGKSSSFVRDVKAAPDPQCVLFTEWQVSDLVRFMTKSTQFTVLVADTTYNLGNFYVTPTTYQHLMLEDSVTKKHPSFLGPVLVHQRKNFSSFNYFASTLIGANTKLRSVQAFGTDGDPALIEALSHNFHSAKQLRCFIHLKKNIAVKLKDRGISSNDSKEFLSDIFGRQCGSSHEEGLVDAENADDFDNRLDNCQDVWLAREASYLREGQLPFFSYFKTQYAGIVRNSMLRDLRRSAGLGSPPAIFTTNACESMNAVIKRKVDYKATEWPQFNESLKEIVEGQRDDAIRALSGRGRYRLCQDYQYLKIGPQEWAVMTPQQRQKVVNQFDSASLQSSRSAVQAARGSSVSTSEGSIKELCITPESTGIVSIPLATLRMIWAKATEYLCSKADVVPAPGSCLKARMVASRSASAPHFVQALPSGQYVCDSNCLQWKSSHMCSHTVAVAALNEDLEAFINWYVTSNQGPNLTTLAVHGLPVGIPKRQRSKCSSSRDTLNTVLRPAVADRVHIRAHKESSFTSPHPTISQAGLHPSVVPQVVNPSPSSSSSIQLAQLNQPPIVNSQSATSISGISCTTPVVTQNQTINIHPPLSLPTSNPFFLKFIQGNIRVCQGCRGSLRNLDGSLPQPPFDLAVARFERRPYRDKTGELRTPAREQAAHYHLKPTCIHVVADDIVLNAPSDIMPLLTDVHKEYLRLMFNVSFS